MSVAWVGAGASVVSGLMSSKSQSKAAGKAADASAAASQQAIAAQREMYDQIRADNAPWRNTGEASLNKLAHLMGLSGSVSSLASKQSANLDGKSLVDTAGGDFRPNQELYNSNAGYKTAYDAVYKANMDKYGVAPNLSRKSNADSFESQIRQAYQPVDSTETATDYSNDPSYGSLLKSFSMDDYVEDPGYQFRLSEGQKGLDRSAAARGGLQSGSALKAAANYSQNAASNEYGNAYSRYNNNQNTIYNRLMGVSGSGQSANNATSAAGSNYANQVGSNFMQNGDNQGNAQLAAGNARGSAYSGISKALGSYDWSKLGGGTSNTYDPLPSGWDNGYYGINGNGG